jgi:hypothetical protein
MLKQLPRLILLGLATLAIPAMALEHPAKMQDKESAVSAKEKEMIKESKEALSDALKACIAEGISSEQVRLTKQKVYEQDFEIVGLGCSGPKAKSLYDAMKTKPQAPYGGRQAFVKYLGRSTVPSLCSLSVQNDQNSYNCLIRLDLSKELTNEIR